MFSGKLTPVLALNIVTLQSALVWLQEGLWPKSECRVINL